MNELETVLRRIVREEVEAVVAAVKPPAARWLEPMDPRALLSIAKVADLLQVGRDYVYARIASGELPVVELGGSKQKRRIKVSDLDAFIRSRSFPR